MELRSLNINSSGYASIQMRGNSERSQEASCTCPGDRSEMTCRSRVSTLALALGRLVSTISCPANTDYSLPVQSRLAVPALNSERCTPLQWPNNAFARNECFTVPQRQLQTPNETFT